MAEGRTVSKAWVVVVGGGSMFRIFYVGDVAVKTGSYTGISGRSLGALGSFGIPKMSLRLGITLFRVEGI